jgi:hypothetical protein
MSEKSSDPDLAFEKILALRDDELYREAERVSFDPEKATASLLKRLEDERKKRAAKR